MLIAIEVGITIQTVKNNKKQVFIKQDNTKSLLDKSNTVFFTATQTSGRFKRNDPESSYKFFDCSLVNSKKSAFISWKIYLPISKDAYLENYWNCEITLDDLHSILEITPKIGVNNKIASNSETSFGFMLSSTEPIFIKSTEITGFFNEHFLENPFLRNIFFTIILVVLVMLTFLFMYRYYLKTIQYNKEQIKHDYHIINQTMKTFANFIDNKDSYTRGHSSRVAAYSREIAKRMSMTADFQRNIYYSGLMHDIGKITIPDEILNKTTHLSDDEWELIKKHTDNGAVLLKDFTIIPMIKNAVLFHHERYDGNGYPQALSGDNIPLEARIVCIADSYDAMATTRCYRLEYSEERIISELTRCAGKQFDPKIVPFMLEIIKDGTIYKLTNANTKTL
ncbi:MAG: HD-GYP domain-containing protein [Treponema sp.]|nr:HD-GYP domain-containing protein [Treponema sp.]